ncbi:unnamed protein product [Porites lobata]|uniref:UMOD/GP2/OIT3-like D8C domain-containing protein n=1 Tax=Porites lobata TaxID=104759 RepID=A0ABN8QQK7_9CNID|nr:unnamed protein product [Porites lobata]
MVCVPLFRSEMERIVALVFLDILAMSVKSFRDYNVLSHPNRHQSFGRGTNSDGNLVPGWYRFQSSSYSRMVDNCIQVHRCTTDVTGWLTGGHPTFKDGIVDRKACFHG